MPNKDYIAVYIIYLICTILLCVCQKNRANKLPRKQFWKYLFYVLAGFITKFMPAWSNSLDLEIKPVDEIRLLKGWDSQSWYIISTNALQSDKPLC